MSCPTPVSDACSLRAEQIDVHMGDLGVDALLIHGAANRRYLSGFTGSTGILVIGPECRTLVTDFRYTIQACEQAAGFKVIESVDLLADLSREVAALDAVRVGVEAEHLSYSEFQKLQARLAGLERPVALEPLERTVERLRSVKDMAEVAIIRKAIDLADEAMTRAADWIQPGVTERELSGRLDAAMRELGSERSAFDTIVAAGPNGAMAHHSPGDRPIGEGEPVIVDMGAVVEGYCSDITRTFVAGRADETFRRVYGLVLDAQLTAEDGLQPGMSALEADSLARDSISAAGHRDDFGHGTGHGVGLEIHEAPRLSMRSEDILLPGMVTSVEPGVYLRGWGGVRIEDLVLIQDSGAEVLTQAPK